MLDARQPAGVFVFASRIIKCMHYQRVEHATPPESLKYGYPRSRGRSSRLYSVSYPTKGCSYRSSSLCHGTVLIISLALVPTRYRCSNIRSKHMPMGFLLLLSHSFLESSSYRCPPTMAICLRNHHSPIVCSRCQKLACAKRAVVVTPSSNTCFGVTG